MHAWLLLCYFTIATSGLVPLLQLLEMFFPAVIGDDVPDSWPLTELQFTTHMEKRKNRKKN
jgi:hypothetical protein